DLRCKLGMEGMYRNCMQDKCAACFIFNDGFENTIAKNRYIHLSPHSSYAHAQLMGTRSTANTGPNNDSYQAPDNKIQCMVLTFVALGRSYDVPPGQDKMKRPPKGWDVVHRQFDIPPTKDDDEALIGDEYGVFAADAAVPLAMVLYRVI
ncbi:hypothetical protein BGW38_008374, partial [Lunasporangiospora selenospora]